MSKPNWPYLPSHRSLIPAALLLILLPAWSQDLPDGKGKELVAAQCNSCHTLASRVGAGYTPEGWATVMRMMVNQGVNIPADQLPTFTEYLSKSFPEKGKPAAVVVEGPMKVSVQAWTVPTPGSRPHDPLAARRRVALVHRPDGQRARQAGSEDRPVQGISRSRRRTPGRMDSRRTRTATSGTRGTPAGWSAGSIRKRARSPNIRCPIRKPRIRTR